MNSFSGSVAVTFPNGRTYTPGVNQHLIVTVTDAAQRRWGFQLTARAAGSPQAQAGTFNPTDTFTQVMCASSDLIRQGIANPCPSSMPLQYIEHTAAGTRAGQTGSATFEFDWTPPATGVGNITIYVAGNAANGDLTNNGDHIYTASYTLAPAAAGTSPSISQGGVISASAFGAFSAITPGTWLEIYGSNLSATTRTWTADDFQGATAPTSLDNVKVTVGGQPAFVDYISPTQVNAQVPGNIGASSATVTVTNSSGTSAPYTVSVNPIQPGLLAPASFQVNGKQYVASLFPDGTTFVLPQGALAGVTSRPAKPGDTVILYGVGFGPVTPDIPPGSIVSVSNQIAAPVQIMFGGTPATLSYWGLAPNFVGLYQFNVVVPAVPDNDLVPLTFTVGNTTGSQTLFIAVHQ